MSIEGAIRSRATTHVGLSALIGTRCFAVKLPQNPVFPAMTFNRISAEREHAMGADANPTHARFQLTAFDDGYADARGLADQIKAAFDRWSGTVDTTVIQDSLREGGDLDLYNDETKTYMAPVDFMIHYEE